MNEIIGLGYLGFEVSDRAAWRGFAEGLVGLAAREEGEVTLLRCDGRDRRILLHEGPADDLAYAGWEVRDAGALARLSARLQAAGHAVEPGSSEDCARRGAAALIRTQDPFGTRLEFACGLRDSAEPFVSPAMRSPFVTGDQGLGHFVLNVPDGAVADRFYLDLLGMRLSDFYENEVKGHTIRVSFVHTNARHHSIGYAAVPRARKRMHHFMLQVEDMNDVGLCYDRFLKAHQPIVQSLGMHPNDRMFSFYGRTPSGFAIEVGFGARTVDDADWTVEQYDQMSSWGHLPPASHAYWFEDRQ